MSHNVVNFAATPVNSTTTARIALSNPKHSRLSSPVIRGAILPQGPKVFEFLVPDGIPLEISPRVGTIGLDEVCGYSAVLYIHFPTQHALMSTWTHILTHAHTHTHACTHAHTHTTNTGTSYTLPNMHNHLTLCTASHCTISSPIFPLVHAHSLH